MTTTMPGTTWRWTTLGEVADVVGGGTPTSSNPSYFGGDIPWITPADLSGYREKYISRGNRNITEAGLANSGARMMPAGTVLFSSRAPIGYVAIAANPVCTNQGFKSFVLSDGLLPDFVYYYLQHAKKLAVDLASGTTFLEISGKKAAQIPIPVPPLEEQRGIVEEIETQLSRLEAGVAGLRRAQASLRRYRAATLKAACEGRLVPTEAELARAEGRDYETGAQLLGRCLTEAEKSKGRLERLQLGTDLGNFPDGWTWCYSGDLLRYVTSGSRGWAQYYSDQGAIFLRIGNLNHEDPRLDLKDIQRVQPPAGAEGARTLVQADDILISITADVGMVALVPEGLGEAYINQHVSLARPVFCVCPAYLAHYLGASEGGWGWFKKLQRGATKMGLGLDDIRNVPVPLPPLAEQARIVAEVERRLSVVDQLEAAVTANLRRATRLRQSVLAAAFSGGAR